MRLIVIYPMDHLARTYPATTGRAVQRAMVEGSPHLHERKAWHIDDYTRRTVRKAWESLGREPEPWLRAEGGRGGSQGPCPGVWMVCADCQPRYAATRCIIRGGLCRDAVTLGGTAWLDVQILS